jgi:hypothetical protein
VLRQGRARRPVGQRYALILLSRRANRGTAVPWPGSLYARGALARHRCSSGLQPKENGDLTAGRPPPPGQGAFGGAVGGAVVGGILGGVLTGRPGGAAAGAIVGGATGAIIGAQAEQRHGYYLWQGVCYYGYPSGQYAAVDPRYCN